MKYIDITDGLFLYNSDFKIVICDNKIGFLLEPDTKPFIPKKYPVFYGGEIYSLIFTASNKIYFFNYEKHFEKNSSVLKKFGNKQDLSKEKRWFEGYDKYSISFPSKIEIKLDVT